MDQTKVAIFKGKEIRKTIYKNEWWFSVVDIIAVLTESTIPRRYWADLKRKLISEGFNELYEKIVQLKIESSDGKKYSTDCANTETVFRIIQTIPSPKAEPFKRWLARVGYKSDAKAGGEIAGGARKNLEKRLNRSIVSKENYLPKKIKNLKVSTYHTPGV